MANRKFPSPAAFSVKPLSSPNDTNSHCMCITTHIDFLERLDELKYLRLDILDILMSNNTSFWPSLSTFLCLPVNSQFFRPSSFSHFCLRLLSLPAKQWIGQDWVLQNFPSSIWFSKTLLNSTHFISFIRVPFIHLPSSTQHSPHFFHASTTLILFITRLSILLATDRNRSFLSSCLSQIHWPTFTTFETSKNNASRARFHLWPRPSTPASASPSKASPCGRHHGHQ